MSTEPSHSPQQPVPHIPGDGPVPSETSGGAGTKGLIFPRTSPHALQPAPASASTSTSITPSTFSFPPTSSSSSSPYPYPPSSTTATTQPQDEAEAQIAAQQIPPQLFTTTTDVLNDRESTSESVGGLQTQVRARGGGEEEEEGQGKGIDYENSKEDQNQGFGQDQDRYQESDGQNQEQDEHHDLKLDGLGSGNEAEADAETGAHDGLKEDQDQESDNFKRVDESLRHGDTQSIDLDRELEADGGGPENVAVPLHTSFKSLPRSNTPTPTTNTTIITTTAAVPVSATAVEVLDDGPGHKVASAPTSGKPLGATPTTATDSIAKFANDETETEAETPASTKHKNKTVTPHKITLLLPPPFSMDLVSEQWGLGELPEGARFSQEEFEGLDVGGPEFENEVEMERKVGKKFKEEWELSAGSKVKEVEEEKKEKEEGVDVEMDVMEASAEMDTERIREEKQLAPQDQSSPQIDLERHMRVSTQGGETSPTAGIPPIEIHVVPTDADDRRREANGDAEVGLELDEENETRQGNKTPSQKLGGSGSSIHLVRADDVDQQNEEGGSSSPLVTPQSPSQDVSSQGQLSNGPTSRQAEDNDRQGDTEEQIQARLDEFEVQVENLPPNVNDETHGEKESELPRETVLEAEAEAKESKMPEVADELRPVSPSSGMKRKWEDVDSSPAKLREEQKGELDSNTMSMEIEVNTVQQSPAEDRPKETTKERRLVSEPATETKTVGIIEKASQTRQVVPDDIENSLPRRSETGAANQNQEKVNMDVNVNMEEVELEMIDEGPATTATLLVEDSKPITHVEVILDSPMPPPTSQADVTPLPRQQPPESAHTNSSEISKTAGPATGTIATMGPNGLPVLTPQHYHPKVIALAKKLAAARGMKLLIDEEAVERMRNRGRKKQHLTEHEVGDDQMNGSASEADRPYSTLSTSLLVKAVDFDLNQQNDNTSSNERRHHRQASGTTSYSKISSASSTPAPGSPASFAPPSVRSQFGPGSEAGDHASTTPESLSHHETPILSSRILAINSHLAPTKGGSHRKKSKGNWRAQAKARQQMALEQKELQQQQQHQLHVQALERAAQEALPNGMSVAPDGSLKPTDEVMYEKKMRDMSKGIGSSSWWNHLLINARKQRGPQWDINTQMYQVDRFSALYYQTTEPPPSTPSSEPEDLAADDHDADIAMDVDAPPLTMGHNGTLPVMQTGLNVAVLPSPPQHIPPGGMQSGPPGMPLSFHHSPINQMSQLGQTDMVPGPSRLSATPGMSAATPGSFGGAHVSPAHPMNTSGSPPPHGYTQHGLQGMGPTSSSPLTKPLPLQSTTPQVAPGNLPPNIAANLTPQQLQQYVRAQQQRTIQVQQASVAQQHSPSPGQVQFNGQLHQPGQQPSPAQFLQQQQHLQASMGRQNGGSQGSPSNLTPQQMLQHQQQLQQQQQAMLAQMAMAQNAGFGIGSGNPPNQAGLAAMMSNPNVNPQFLMALQARMGMHSGSPQGVVGNGMGTGIQQHNTDMGRGVGVGGPYGGARTDSPANAAYPNSGLGGGGGGNGGVDTASLMMISQQKPQR